MCAAIGVIIHDDDDDYYCEVLQSGTYAAMFLNKLNFI